MSKLVAIYKKYVLHILTYHIHLDFQVKFFTTKKYTIKQD